MRALDVERHRRAGRWSNPETVRGVARLLDDQRGETIVRVSLCEERRSVLALPWKLSRAERSRVEETVNDALLGSAEGRHMRVVRAVGELFRCAVTHSVEAA